jgi:hypothetical protein
MMLYEGMDQALRMGDAPRADHQERRTFARRIDCDSSPRTRVSDSPARVRAPWEHDGWERSRPGYGR